MVLKRKPIASAGNGNEKKVNGSWPKIIRKFRTECLIKLSRCHIIVLLYFIELYKKLNNLVFFANLRVL